MLSAEQLNDSQGLIPYLEVLLEIFPKHITQAELAERTNVTPPAVSKIIERIKPICDIEVLAFERKLVLRNDDETATKVAQAFFYTDRPLIFVLSKYFRHQVKRWNIHETVAKSFPTYGKHLQANDTTLIIDIVFENVRKLELSEHLLQRIRDPELRTHVLGFDLLMAFTRILDHLELPIDNTDKVNEILALRDKVFCLIKEFLVENSRKLRILQPLTTSEKEAYLNVYARTIDFYLRDQFYGFTNYVMKTCKSRKIIFPEENRPLGSLHPCP